MGAYAWRSLDQVGFGRAHDSPLRRQCHEALLSVAIMMKSEAENDMKAEIGGLDRVIWAFAAMRNLLGVPGFVAVV